MPAKPGRPRKAIANAKAKRGRNDPQLPANLNLPSTTARTASKAAAGTKRPRKIAPESDEDELQEDLSAASLQQLPKKQKTANSNDGSKPTPSARTDRKPRIKFPFLKAQTRNIPKSTIASKWRAAPIPAQQAARQILVNAKRGVTLDRHDNKRRIEAEVNLASLLRNLEKKLPRVPLPPRTGESQFDLDKVVEHNRGLENDLTPALHAVELLEAAVREERERLQQDRRLLSGLEQDFRSQENFQKRTVKIHPLLKEQHTGATDGPRDINLHLTSGLDQQKQLDWAALDKGSETSLEQLRGHLASLRTNAAQVEGLDIALSDAYAELGGALTKYTTRKHHDKLSF
ncbi:CENP-Q, a CENPA-CAD centromere complex subunit-domain-containing protein [Phyllosticta capitalensis]